MLLRKSVARISPKQTATVGASHKNLCKVETLCVFHFKHSSTKNETAIAQSENFCLNFEKGETVILH